MFFLYSYTAGATWSWLTSPNKPSGLEWCFIGCGTLSDTLTQMCYAQGSMMLFYPSIPCYYCCYNIKKVNPFLTYYVFLVLLLACRPVFYVTVCVFYSVTVQEEECCTQTISLCGFYFLLQAAKMGESDTYIFSIEVRALTGSYTLVKKKGT